METNTNRDQQDILLEVKNLKKYFPIRTGFVKKTDLKAVDDVSFFIRKGETLGIVGESGCGKTTLGRTILRLEEPTSGDIRYDGETIIGKDMKPYRNHMQIVFQDPYASLDPRKTVSDIIGEAMDIQNDEPGGIEPGILQPFSPRVFRRSETANRYCQSSCGGSGIYRL